MLTKRFPNQTLLYTLIVAALGGCADGGQTDAAANLGGKADAAAVATSSDAAVSSGTFEKAVVADAGGTWQRVGGENDTITVPANTTVRYGANGAYVQKVVSGAFVASNAFFGNDPAYGVYKTVEAFAAASDSTNSWQRVGGENDTITVPANSTVRYGANGAYVQKVVSGAFVASNAFFGNDPIYGVYKTVELLVTASAAGGTWQRVGGENDTITVPANTTVRYGANGAYVQKVVSGAFVASNAFFGNDPAYGVYKTVEVLSGAAAPAQDTTPAGNTPEGTTQPAPAPAPVAPSAPAPAPVGNVIKVGPGQAVARIADAARIAKDGDTIEIQAGTYYGDVATWRQNNLTIRGVGGRPVLDANGVSAQGKGIFVISGTNVTIDNLEFTNAKVPDQNGAGIRMEGGSLVVRNAVFRNNENSFITTADENATLEIHDSQFLNNGFWYTNGLAHGIYINRIGRLTIQGSYFTGTQAGHLVKSRAKESRILYNRITDEQGAASYQADFPDGGTVYLIGNIIEKNVNPQNPSVISYGLENRVWASNDIHVANNTIISRRGGGCRWIQAAGWSTVRWTNNVLLGNNCDYSVPSGMQQAGNFLLADGDFANAAGYDFRLRAGSSAVGRKVDAGSVNGLSLSPVREYRHTATSIALTRPATNTGALQATN